MKLPLGQLVDFDSNVYEITSAVITRATQVTKLRKIYGKELIGTSRRVDKNVKAVIIALDEVLSGEVLYKHVG